ncbi:MAG TPA: hypothetical protein VM238_15895 [Phycisphaerae bacterium]|nr:hypothetical protein [Phycisphaerae bacterium]
MALGGLGVFMRRRCK